MKAARGFKPDHVITLGDFADFYAVSSHDKDPLRMQRFEDEIASTNAALDQLETLGASRYDFIKGNHEYRLERYLMQKAPELYGMVTTEKLLHLKDRGWKCTQYREHLKVGKVYFTHDDGSAGYTANVRARASYEGNVVIGHVHTISVNYKGTARGNSHVGCSFGWLGNVNDIDYMHRVKAAAWQLGFGVGYLENNGTMHLRPCPIINYSVELEGKIYRA